MQETNVCFHRRLPYKKNNGRDEKTRNLCNLLKSVRLQDWCACICMQKWADYWLKMSHRPISWCLIPLIVTVLTHDYVASRSHFLKLLHISKEIFYQDYSLNPTHLSCVHFCLLKIRNCTFPKKRMNFIFCFNRFNGVKIASFANGLHLLWIHSNIFGIMHVKLIVNWLRSCVSCWTMNKHKNRSVIYHSWNMNRVDQSAHYKNGNFRWWNGDKNYNIWQT